MEALTTEEKRRIPLETLTADEAARMLGCSRSKLQELLRTGELPSFKVGRRRMALRADVEALIERRLKAEGPEVR